MKRSIQAILLVGAAALLLAAPAISHAQDAAEAEDVTTLSKSATKEDGRAVRRTRDRNVQTYAEYEADEAFSLVWGAEAGVRTAYVKWYAQPDYAILVQSDETGAELSRERIEQPSFNDSYAILPEARGLTLSCENGMRIAEVMLYSEGALPEGLYDWLPPFEKADLLVVSAHCDDEFIFFGGTIPYYAGERGLAVQIVYMANGDRARVDEALNGLWHAGVRNAPVFLPFQDVYTETLRLALLNWGEEDTIAALVGVIRRFQPEVIVSHDLNGEYGHGAHMATASCMRSAVAQAADASAYPDSSAATGAWQTQKLYLHLYPEHAITMDWNRPLAAFGGKTALEVANEAYHMHVSQLDYHSNVYGEGEYSSLEYGLAFTAVGEDAAKDDFFEHIDPARLSGYVAPTPAPTDTPAPTETAPTARPTPNPSAAPESDSRHADIPPVLLGGVLVLVVLGAALLIAEKKRAKKRKTKRR